MLEGSRSAAQIGGPAVAGALTSLLVAPIAVAASSLFFLAAVMTVYLLFLPRTLELPGAVVGLALAAMGLGALAGSVLAGFGQLVESP